MLSFSFSSLFIHKKKRVVTTAPSEIAPPEIFINGENGEIIRDPLHFPQILAVGISDIDFNSAQANWNVFVPPDSSTRAEVQVYTYSENDPYDAELLRYTKNLIFAGDTRIFATLTNLSENTSYRLRIRAVSTVNAQTLTGEWVETTFQTGAIPISFTGSYNGFYYINGVKTTLSSSGEGVWNGAYYVNGVVTNLEYIECLNSWIGYLWGRFYVNFEEYNGIFNCSCCTGIQQQMYDGNYINGLRRPLNWTGSGFASAYAPVSPWMSGTYGHNLTTVIYGPTTIYYTSFVPYTGFANNTFYVNGIATPFDLQGAGSITVGNTTYNFSSGAPINGNRNGKYYIGGVETNLSVDGSGTWNGKIYNKGAFVSAVNTPYIWGSGTGSIGDSGYYGSSFGSGITYG